jgi:hypothetical protein
MSDMFPLLDKHGLVRIPLRFYAVLLLLMRPFIVWIIVLTMPEGGDRFLASMFYCLSFASGGHGIKSAQRKKPCWLV